MYKERAHILEGMASSYFIQLSPPKASAKLDTNFVRLLQASCSQAKDWEQVGRSFTKASHQLARELKDTQAYPTLQVLAQYDSQTA